MLLAVPMNGQTWLICGGRDFTDRAIFDDAMGDLLGVKGCPRKIIHGAARGADALAAEWGARHALDVAFIAADWASHGKAAGPIRNQKMLEEHKPDFVVVFPGGRGTADMVSRARKAGIDVAEINLQ